MNKVAIYSRVSTEEQNNLNQLLALKKFADERNLEYDIYSDVESSKKTRPTRNILMNKIRTGIKYEAIVVWGLDRWSRKPIEILNDINELLKNGINFISINDGINIKETGEEALKLLSAFYSLELKRISERTKLGLERAKQQGKKLGRPVGSKDSKKRSSVGYFVREAIKRRNEDKKKGKNMALTYYMRTNKFNNFDELENIIKSDLSKK